MARTPGPKPKPTPLLKLHGTLRKKRHQSRAAEPVAYGRLEAPDYLTPGQRESWTYAMANAPADVLAKIDRGVMVAWCEAEDRHRQAIQMQARQDSDNPLPLLAKGRQGDTIMSPYLRVINQSADLMIRCASELGFTPAARPRLVPRGGAEAPATMPTPDSPWTKLKLLQGGLT
jgi:P27 family predicted phage terminase small subunit